MILGFFSLKAMRVGGLALGYAAIVWLSRTQGPAELGQYLFLLNSVVVVGTLSALSLPTLVQRLSARLESDSIGAGTVIVLRGRGFLIPVMAAAGAMVLLALDADRPLTLPGAAMLTAAAVGFAVTLVLIETLRVTRGPKVSEVQRNLVRPALILLLLLTGIHAYWAVPIGVLGALAVVLWMARWALRQDTRSDASIAAYVRERARDLPTVFGLEALGLVFGAMDLVLFGLLENATETGIYGASSRFGMLVNVALLAGNAQMIRHIAKVAAGNDVGEVSLASMRRQIRLVRFSSTGLFLALLATLPVYAWIVDLPADELWPYFLIVAGSYWLQGMLGPANMFLVQGHEAGRLIRYHFCGIVVFGLVASILFVHGTTLAIPLGVAAGANTVKILAWLRVRRSWGLRI